MKHSIVVLLADSEGPDQSARNAQANLDIRCPHKLEETFSHGTAIMILNIRSYAY